MDSVFWTLIVLGLILLILIFIKTSKLDALTRLIKALAELRSSRRET